jgi:hypothetical protein
LRRCGQGAILTNLLDESKPVTSFYVSGAVHFPLDLRLYRRYEEVTGWETFLAKRFPGRTIPTMAKERARLHREVDAVLLQDAEFQAMHQQFRTKIDLASALVEATIRHKVPFGVVLFDGWYLADDLVRVVERRQGTPGLGHVSDAQRRSH